MQAESWKLGEGGCGEFREEIVDSEWAEGAIVSEVRKVRWRWLRISSAEGLEGSGDVELGAVVKWEAGNSVGSVRKFGSDILVLRKCFLKCINCEGDRQFFWEEGWLAGWAGRTELGSFD